MTTQQPHQSLKWPDHCNCFPYFHNVFICHVFFRLRRPGTCPNNGKRLPQECPADCRRKTYEKAGIATFSKIRIDLDTLTIDSKKILRLKPNIFSQTIITLKPTENKYLGDSSKLGERFTCTQVLNVHAHKNFQMHNIFSN